MPQPDAYERQRNFTNYSTTYPASPHNGSWLDEEFNDVVRATEEIVARLALIQRDDGQVKNNTIGLDQLKPEVVFGPATDWVTATEYAVHDVVWQSSVLYVCNTAHTSGVFATDLAATKWTAYLDYADPLGDAEDAATAAQAAQAAAETAEANAETAQTAAEAAQAAAEAAQAAAEAAVLAITLPLAIAEGGHGATTAAQGRTNLGIGTGDSPQFAGLNVGHASDTTVTRASAGVIAVEGSNVLMASNIGVTVQSYDADTFFKDQGGTVAAETTFSAGAVFDRAVDANLATFGNATTTHDLLVRFASAGALAEFTPAPSGSADATKGFGYDFTNGRWFCDTNLNVGGQVLGPNGTAAAPTYGFAGTAGVGMYWVGGECAFSNGSALIFYIGSGRAVTLVPLYYAAGSAAAPAIAHKDNVDTGMYFPSTTSVGFTIDNSLKLDVNASRLLAGSGVDIQVTSFGAPADGSVGPRRLVDASITTGTPVAADSGKRIIATGGVTIPASVFAKGDTLVIDAGPSSRTITQGVGLTLTWEASGSTGNRTLVANGRCVVTFESATAATISGSLT